MKAQNKPRPGPTQPREWLRGPRPAMASTAALLLTWWWVVLGPNMLVLAGGLATAAGAAWLVRRHRALAASIVIAAITTAVPGLLAIWIVSAAPADAPTVAAVLTGHIIAGPAPALLAWTRRHPTARRLVDTIIGSALLLVSAVPIVLVGDHGFGTAALLAGLISVAAWNWRRRRTTNPTPFTVVDDTGWTDLGPRELPCGEIVDQVLVGPGLALLGTRRAASSSELQHVVDQAAQLAAHLHLPPGRLHPVLIDPHATTPISWQPVNTSTASCAVAVTGADDLCTLAHTIGGPARRADRKLRLQMAALPVPTQPGAHR